MAVQTSRFARFMVSAAGRWLRIVIGVALVAWGWSMHSAGGTALALVGLVPIAAGVFDFCLISLFVNAPFRGRDIRAGNVATR
jgi:hypothetical protein